MLQRTFLITALIASTLPSVGLANEMTFKNNLLPGCLTIHKISRLIQRKVPRKDFKEELSYTQTARWVQCNLGERKPGAVTVYQMMVDQPAKVRSLFRGAKKIKPPPSAEHFNLSKGSARLHSVTKGPRDAPYQVPLTNPLERAVLRVMLDFAHWPKKKIQAGHTWDQKIDDRIFKGTQKFEFVDFDKVKGEVVARVTMYVEGDFQGALEKDYAFVKGQAILYWSRLDRTLLKMEARAEYKRLRPGGDEDYEMELKVSLKKLETLNAEDQDRMIEQLNLFATADKRLREDRKADARALCQHFYSAWPDSVWLPVVEELESLAKPKRRLKRLKTSQVKKLLGKSVIAWETGRTNHDYDLIDKTRDALTTLTQEYRDKLLKIAKSKSSKTRAPAIFALAFSENPEDFRMVQKAARDNASTVRAMALAGLAARGSPQTSVEMLLGRLDDKKAKVRARACQAIAACVPREHFSVAKVVEKVTHLMIHDKKVSVRREAIRALAAVGAPADIPKLEKALNHELEIPNREEIKKAIARLESLHD
ncbi:MAG: HEAT repeat domain-containing protein [Phycisphaerales bacterium]|nr:HEAT repeat domain-containing protein [Phycisphaerales bacterium]